MAENVVLPTITEMGCQLRSGKLNCATIADLSLQRISHCNPDINCFIRIFDKAAREQAAKLDEELATEFDRGPLHGIPVAIKDIFDFPGYTASGGSALERRSQQHYATVVKRLEAAGAIIVGTLNLDELAAGGTGDNAFFGRCKNPWNHNHITGGSSGGSAAAVAAGLVSASIGSDAGGSIRIPAAFCGVLGLKPTYGRVSRFGALARTWSMDCIGPLTRTAQEAAIVFNAILGADPDDATSVTSHRVDLAVFGNRTKLPVLGVCKDIGGSDSDGNFSAAIDQLADAGYTVRDVSIPELDRYTELQQVIVKSEGAAMHGNALSNGDARMSHAVRSVISGGLAIPAVRYIEALSVRKSLLGAFVREVLTDTEIVIAPVTLTSAPPFVSQQALQAEQIDREFSEMATLTRFANFLGVPALSIPTGTTSEGLPTAIQLVGRPFAEELLLSVASHYESLRGPIVCPGN